MLGVGFYIIQASSCNLCQAGTERYLNAVVVSGSGTLKYLSEVNVRVKEKDFRDVELHLCRANELEALYRGQSEWDAISVRHPAPHLYLVPAKSAQSTGC